VFTLQDFECFGDLADAKITRSPARSHFGVRTGKNQLPPVHVLIVAARNYGADVSDPAVYVVPALGIEQQQELKAQL
jgi:hypothetical protein